MLFRASCAAKTNLEDRRSVGCSACVSGHCWRGQCLYDTILEHSNSRHETTKPLWRTALEWETFFSMRNASNFWIFLVLPLSDTCKSHPPRVGEEHWLLTQAWHPFGNWARWEVFNYILLGNTKHISSENLTLREATARIIHTFVGQATLPHANSSDPSMNHTPLIQKQT